MGQLALTLVFWMVDKLMKRYLHILTLLLLPALAHAQTCLTATCNAASTSESDVLAALPSPSNTNPTVTVNIPSGTVVWTTGFAYAPPSALTSLIIQGNTTVNCTGTAGTSSYACVATDNTVFVDSYVVSNTPLMNFHLGGKAFRMTGVTFQGGTLVTGVTKPNGFMTFDGTTTNFRIDHSHFNTNTYTPVNSGGGMTIFTNVYGVVDHTVFDLYAQNNGVRVYNSDFGDFNWSQLTNFGTLQFMFLENDVFNGGAMNDCDDGGRIVIRYSTMIAATSGGDQGLWQTHQMGQGTERSRGCRAEEVYNLYVLNPNPSNALYTVGDGGSGTGVAFNNTISSGYNYDIGFQNIREVSTGHSQTAPTAGIGYCGTGSNGASSAWDGNTNSMGYPCIDQTGRGQGDLLNGLNFPGALDSVTGTVTWPHNMREPWYVWNETIASGHVYINPVWSGTQIMPDRDFYVPATSFDGSTGTGFGLASTKPTHCTAGPGGTYDTSPGGGSWGTGFYETDTGLFRHCIATDTWDAGFNPVATYPHPLISAQTATPTLSPTGGTYSSTQTVTISDSSPSPVIHYTTDGSTPTSGSTLYTSSISVSVNTTVKAVADSSGLSQSPVGTAVYVIGLAAPVYSAGTGKYLTLPSITLTLPSAANGCFTLDGSTPTGSAGSCTHGSTYSGPITISTSGTTLKSIATKSGVSNSTETDATYTLVPIIINSSGLFDGGSGSFSTGTVTTNPSAGDLITCELVFAGASLVSLQDNVNAGGYSVAVPLHANIGAQVGMFYKVAAAGTTVTTFTLSGTAGSVALTCQDWKALSGVPTLDSAFVLQQDGTNATPTTGPSRTPAANNELVLADLITNSETPAVGTNYTALAFSPDGPDLFPQYWIQGTAISTSAPYTIASGESWTDQMAAFAFLGNTVAVPTVSPVAGAYGTAQSVVPSTTTPSATLCFTIDGTTPTGNGLGGCLHGTPYTTAINVAVSLTLKVMGTESGFTDSAVTTAVYTINGGAVAPTASPTAGAYGPTQNVVLSSGTSGAHICFTTDGTTPTGDGAGNCTHGTQYTTAVSVSVSLTLKAMTTKLGWIDSGVSSFVYTINGSVATPTYLPVAGTYSVSQSVVVSITTPGATICFTVDGTVPTANGAGVCTHGSTCAGPVSVGSTLTLKAMASKNGFTDSLLSSGLYTITATLPAPTGLHILLGAVN